MEDFFLRSGPLSPIFFEQRQFPRFYLRTRAVLERDAEFSTIYTKDISRKGIGLLAVTQLFPCEQVTVWLPTGPIGPVEIRRCRRQADRCFQIGAQFATHDAEDIFDRVSHLIAMSSQV